MPTTRRCVFCHGALPANDAIEHFPVGKRVAFDPGRGRLWAVCPSCKRWNLAPFEERWEALEELEKAHRDRGRVLASTDNVALIHTPGVELVRVGQARLVEEAWWRYGAEMLKRRSRARMVSFAENATMVGASIATGGMFWLFMDGDLFNKALRWKKFGSMAWKGRGDVRCDRCGGVISDLTFKDSNRLILTHDAKGDPALRLRCRLCRITGSPGVYRLEGVTAHHVIRRVLTYNHYRGASEKRVRSATRYIDELGAPEAVTRTLSREDVRLGSLLKKGRRTEALALEIALNDENERRLLEMELAELEARWEEEEEIAAIVDGQLTPVSGLGRIRRLLGGD